MRAQQSALASQHGAIADADRVLADVLASAHTGMRESTRRLDAIAEEIDRAVQHQADLAIDTPMGVREFHNFLLAKQHEIVAVVTQARDLNHAKTAVLHSLWSQYAGSAG